MNNYNTGQQLRCLEEISIMFFRHGLEDSGAMRF